MNSEFETDSDSDWDDSTSSNKMTAWPSELEKYNFSQPLMCHVSYQKDSKSEPQTNSSETKYSEFNDIDSTNDRIDKETTCVDISLKIIEANLKWIHFYGCYLTGNEVISSQQRFGNLATKHNGCYLTGDEVITSQRKVSNLENNHVMFLTLIIKLHTMYNHFTLLITNTSYINK